MKKVNEKGFTLIELLAVIVILGIIMLIAIPSVSNIISNSRKNTFRSSAQTLISGARNMVLASSDGKPSAGDGWESVANTSLNANVKTGSYIIKVGNVKVESGSNTKGPYGENYAEDYSYVIAVPNDDGTYVYWIQLVDIKGNNIPLSKESDLDGDSVVGNQLTMTENNDSYTTTGASSFTQYTTSA